MGLRHLFIHSVHHIHLSALLLHIQCADRPARDVPSDTLLIRHQRPVDIYMQDLPRHHTSHYDRRAFAHIICHAVKDDIFHHLLPCNTRIHRKVHLHIGDNGLHEFNIFSYHHPHHHSKLLLHVDQTS